MIYTGEFSESTLNYSLAAIPIIIGFLLAFMGVRIKRWLTRR